MVRYTDAWVRSPGQAEQVCIRVLEMGISAFLARAVKALVSASQLHSCLWREKCRFFRVE